MVDLHRPAILVPGHRPVPCGVGDELPTGASHQSTGNMFQRFEDRLVTRTQLTQIRAVKLTFPCIEPRIERRDGLAAVTRPRPSAFAPRHDGDTNESAQSVDHPALPQRGIASKIAALTDQPVRIADILDSQQVRLRHHRDSSI